MRYPVQYRQQPEVSGRKELFGKESCKEELQERSKVEAEFEKEEQVRKRVPLNRRFWAAQVVEAQAVV